MYFSYLLYLQLQHSSAALRKTRAREKYRAQVDQVFCTVQVYKSDHVF